jgi:hypothetical protein
MNTDRLVKIGFVVAVVGIGSFIYYSVQPDPEREAAELAARQAAVAAQKAARQASVAAQKQADSQKIAHLDRILDLTVDAMVATERKVKSVSEGKDDEDLGKVSFGYFMFLLEKAYNAANPPLISGNIGVASTKAAKVVAYKDVNENRSWNSEIDQQLYAIDFDTDNGRVIVEDLATGTVHDRTLTQQQRAGSGIMGGFLFGHMMSSQRSFGNPNSVQNKQRTSPSKARSNARSRAGSGSHRRGK